MSKGQSGAAILIALISVMIILYVLFLPPADRAALLGDSQPGTTKPGQPDNNVFSSTVGRVYLASVPGQTHGLPTLSIRAIESGSVLAQRDTLTAKNNVFEKQPATLTFSADTTLTRNTILSMNLQAKSGGNLIVDLNGEQVFNQEINSRSIQPIKLANLQTTNTLTFSASSVGFAFWRTNTYILSNVKVTADVTDLTGASATQRFSISQEEFNNMESAQLSFVPVCNIEGRVSLMINSVELYSGVPDCGSLNTLEVAPSRLQPGENAFSVSTRDADIVIDRAALKTVSKQQQNKVFSFNIDASRTQGRPVLLRILFADATAKRGIISVNGNDLPLSAQSELTVPITQYIRPGVNTIQFEALDRDFEIVKFDVLLG